MDVDNTLSAGDVAAQACASCRKQKRKCDKQLPMCGLCQRIGRDCDYSDDSRGSAPSNEEFTSLRLEVAELKELLARGIPSQGSNGGIHGRASSVISNPQSHGSYNNSFNTHANDHSSDLGSLVNSGSSANLLSLGASHNSSRPDHRLVPANLKRTWPGPSSFPSLYFLDSNAFLYEAFQIQMPHVRVPPGALTALGNSAELRVMIEEYFNTVHTYFPIVSKIRLYQHLSNPMHEPGADIALLFLAMKLMNSQLPEGTAPQTQLYQDVKSFFTYVESQNGFSIQMIQALLLISLYELGHAIYPAVYLTIGHAGRLGHAMGIHQRKAPQMLPRCTTWTEQEERRRVWWGVIILDRFVNIGNRDKPLATTDPSLDTHLPTDDASWDRGHMLVAAPLALSASETIKAAPYARACQASHLLGKVIRHINDINLPVEYRFEEALQLSRTIRALATLLPAEAEGDDPTMRPTLCTSMAICYSALLTLYDAYSCTERAVPNGPETQLQMQKEAIEGLSEISAIVMLHLATRVRHIIEIDGMKRMSPLIIDCLYQAAANYAWYVRESSDPICGERLAELKDLLHHCNSKWRVAGEYVRIIEATEFAMASAIR